MSNVDLLNSLKELVATGALENDCRDRLLSLSKYFSMSMDIEMEAAEHTMQAGRCDLLLVGNPPELQHPHLSISDKSLMVFELKSPRKYWFEFNDKCKRFLPTSDLIQAETQLLNYTYTMRECIGHYSNKYGIRTIEAAGLILGRKENIFKNTSNFRFANEKDEIAEQRMAIQSRNDIIYKAARIKLLDWDSVIQKIENALKHT